MAYQLPNYRLSSIHHFADWIELLCIADVDGIMDDSRVRQEARQQKEDLGEPSYTIVAHSSHVPLHPRGKPMVNIGKDSYALQGSVNRRLSWRECDAIQALPSTLQITGGLHAKYRVVGNAVPPPLAQALIQPVVNYARK